MYQIIIVVHVLLGLSVIGFVLIQQGKGADAGAAFGSASSGSVFGAQGASSFLSRTTAILATLFFATSLGLAILVGHQDGEADLMDAPEVEEVFTDVPLIDGGDNTPATESVPVTTNDVPATIIEDVQSTTEGTETIIEEVKIEAAPE
jgi:preprotein translocase subunit SecG